MVHGHPGAGVDKQVAADGAGVGNLALAHRGGAHAGSRLAELVYLVNNTAQVTGPVLVQAGRHGQWDGGGRYGNVWRGICVWQLPGPAGTRRGLLLEAVGGSGRPCTHRQGKGLGPGRAL